MAANDTVARLQRLAEQAESIRAPPAQPVRKAATVAEALAAKQHHSHGFSITTRNLILGLAALMAVVTWYLTSSFHGHLPTNAMHNHQWTDVTAHFHAHPHAAAASDPRGYTGARPSGIAPSRADLSAPQMPLPSMPRRGNFNQGQALQPPPRQPPVVPAADPNQAGGQAIEANRLPAVANGWQQQHRQPEPGAAVSRETGTKGKGLDVLPPAPRQAPVGPLVKAQQAAAGLGEQGHVKGGGACYGRGSCGLHGECHADECVCTVTYTGPRCEHPVQLPPVLQAEAEVMGNWSAAFEGEMILNQRKMASRSQLTVHLPGKEDDPDHGWRVLISNSGELKLLNDMLPPDDTILRGGFFHSCAVIGSSGIVLNYEHGEEIDQHDMVFRFNSAPTKGFEKHVGSKTTHRITNTQNWGFHERDTENLLIHFRAKSAIKGLFWNQAQRKKLRVFAFDPEFVEYMAFSLDFMATSGLYGIVLAMQRCARVDLYGFQVSTQHGALYHYYDVCDVPANVGRDDSEYQVVRAFARAGLIHFQEPCIIECHNSAMECYQCKQESGFQAVKLPSDAKCAPGRVSRGHLEVPWRRDRHKHNKGHGK